jgi:hypothetical protein
MLLKLDKLFGQGILVLNLHGSALLHEIGCYFPEIGHVRTKENYLLMQSWLKGVMAPGCYQTPSDEYRFG